MVISEIERQPSRWSMQITQRVRLLKKLPPVVHNLLVIGPPGAGEMQLAHRSGWRGQLEEDTIGIGSEIIKHQT